MGGMIQSALHEAIALLFKKRATPDHEDVSPPDHGRIETRRIGCSTALNAYLDFPHVGQAFMIEREVFHKKSAALTIEHALGITRQTPQQADARRVLLTHRGHWVIRIVATTLSIGTSTKTALAFAPATARQTSRACVALPWA